MMGLRSIMYLNHVLMMFLSKYKLVRFFNAKVVFESFVSFDVISYCTLR